MLVQQNNVNILPNNAINEVICFFKIKLFVSVLLFHSTSSINPGKSYMRDNLSIVFPEGSNFYKLLNVFFIIHVSQSDLYFIIRQYLYESFIILLEEVCSNPFSNSNP